jgi:hypothetical protein
MTQWVFIAMLRPSASKLLRLRRYEAAHQPNNTFADIGWSAMKAAVDQAAY